MLRRLICHPDTPPGIELVVTAEIARLNEGGFVVRYAAVGDVSKLRIPGPVPYSLRQDDLWQSTCFEAFISTTTAPYLEFNFAPSTGWAAYRFEGYRNGRENLPVPAPHFDVDRYSDRLEVTVAVDTTDISDLPSADMWRFNLTAVLEEADGTKSYWALAHPMGKPDFHDTTCFALEIPAIG